MSTWTLKTIVVRVRNLFNKADPEPKEPRKKIQLQLNQISKKFLQQKQLLEAAMDKPNLNPSAKNSGRLLLQEANRIEELQLMRINEARLESLYSSLLDTNDFSIWLRYELSVITEEIFHFLSTLEQR